MKVLLTASECSPLVKVGGIADVIGSLPIAIKPLGIDIRICIPFYKPLQKKLEQEPNAKVEMETEVEVEYGGEKHPVKIYKTSLLDTEIPVYMLHNEKFLSYGGIYFTPETMQSPENEIERFAFFSKAIATAFSYPDSLFFPDIIHCNDWHTGMVPQIMQSMHQYTQGKSPRTIFTVHNLAYQGFSKLDVGKKLGLDITTDQTMSWDAQDDNLDFILQGIVGSDYVTTVSEKYAKEIQTPEYGEGLHDILNARESRIKGILNGLSYAIFNPETDKHIFKQYGPKSVEEGKAENKKQLQEMVGLNVDPHKPLIGVVSRLAQQKGMDLIANNAKQMIEMGYQIIVLGTGDPQLELKFKELNEDNDIKGNFSANITFSEEMAMKIYAGSDMFLIPSRYEPSGLTQMIAMKYGSVPVVRATGGLYDTVHHMETGFTFDEFDSKSMMQALKEAFITYSNDKKKWDKIRANGMMKDLSWDESAKRYAQLYTKVIEDS